MWVKSVNAKKRMSEREEEEEGDSDRERRKIGDRESEFYLDDGSHNGVFVFG